MPLVILLLLFSLSFSKDVKVLYRDGTVKVVNLKTVSLQQLERDPRVLYVEKPIRLYPMLDVVRNPALGIRGTGSQSFNLRTYAGQTLRIHTDANLSFSGSCSGSASALSCQDGTLTVSVSSSFPWSVSLSSNKALSPSDITGAVPYYLGTGASLTNLTGRGVVVAIMDTGINWCHPAFRKPDGSTRILFYYKPSTDTEYDSNRINSFINSNVCNMDVDGHGTHVAGIAVGSPTGPYTGIAYESDIIAVDVTSDEGILDTDMIKGLEYLRSKKDGLGKPMVVNMSLGTHMGPHDGTSLLERKIQQLSSPGFVVVAAAGNEGNDRIHAQIPNLSSEVGVPINSGGISAIDGWYSQGLSLRAELCVNANCQGVDPGSEAFHHFGSCSAHMENKRPSPLNGDGHFFITTDCSGLISVKLVPISGSGNVDMYLADVFLSSEFLAYTPLDPLGGYAGTVVMPGTSPHVITAGSIAVKVTPNVGNEFLLGSVSHFSSRGPTRDRRIKPDVVAGGHFVCSANAFYTNNNPDACGPYELYTLKAGTSMASPVVAGLVALILQANPNLDVSGVRQVLISNAKTDPATGSVPNNAYGYGKAYVGDYNAQPSDGTTPPSQGSSGGGGGGGCSLSPSNSALYALVLLLLSVFFRRLVRRGLYRTCPRPCKVARKCPASSTIMV